MPFATCAGHMRSNTNGRRRASPARRCWCSCTRAWARSASGAISRRSVAQATGCRALVYNRYGYGKSDVLAEPGVDVRFMHDEALSALPELLAALGVGAPVPGRPLRRRVDRAHPRRRRPSRARAGADGAARLRRADCAWTASEPRRPRLRDHRPRRAPGQATTATRAGPSTSGPTPGSIRRSCTGTSRSTCPASSCPVMAIQGEDDEYGTMAQLERIGRGGARALRAGEAARLRPRTVPRPAARRRSPSLARFIQAHAR